MHKAFFRQVKFLEQNLQHPSLRAKKYDETSDLWQSRVNQDWRFYFHIVGEIAFELEVPDGAVDKNAEADLVRSVKEQAALKLYAEQRITTGEASDILGLTRIQFLDLLQRSGIGFRVDLDEEDFQMIRRWRDNHTSKSGQ